MDTYNTHDKEKAAILNRVAGSSHWLLESRGFYRVGTHLVHVRAKSPSKNLDRQSSYSFDINPATLNANYELWICGSANHYYLMPMIVIGEMYTDPSSYPNYRRPSTRVVSVDIDHHLAMYARPGKTIKLDQYFRGTLRD